MDTYKLLRSFVRIASRLPDMTALGLGKLQFACFYLCVLITLVGSWIDKNVFFWKKQTATAVITKFTWTASVFWVLAGLEKVKALL